MKTNKSYTKRLKVTKNGKIIARKPGQNQGRAGAKIRHASQSMQVESTKKSPATYS